jgi:hypothetical protein
MMLALIGVQLIRLKPSEFNSTKSHFSPNDCKRRGHIR